MTLILRVKIAQDVSSLSNITTDLIEFETRLICPHLKLSSQYCAAYQLRLADIEIEHGHGQAGRQDVSDGWRAPTSDGGIVGEEEKVCTEPKRTLTASWRVWTLSCKDKATDCRRGIAETVDGETTGGKET